MFLFLRDTDAGRYLGYAHVLPNKNLLISSYGRRHFDLNYF